MIHPTQIRELVEFRKTIELAALEAAYPHMGENEYKQLIALNEESVIHKDDLDVKIQLDFKTINFISCCVPSAITAFIKRLWLMP